MTIKECNPSELSTSYKIDEANSRIKKRRIGLIFRILLSTVLLLVIVSRVDLHVVLELLEHTDILKFNLLVIILIADRFLMSFKWKLLLQANKVGLSIWQSFKIYLISNFIGVFLPTGVGSDIFRIYYTSKSVGQGEKIAASVFMERFLGIIASTMFAAFGLAILTGYSGISLFESKTAAIIFGMLVFFSVAFWFSIQKVTLTFIENLFRRWKHLWFYKKWFQCHQAYLEYTNHKRTLLVFVFLSMFEQGLYAFANYVGSKGINLSLDLIYFLGIIPICIILIRIPISINSIGVREGLYVFFFSMFGISASEAFSLALLVRIGDWLSILPGSVLYLTDTFLRKEILKFPSK